MFQGVGGKGGIQTGGNFPLSHSLVRSHVLIIAYSLPVEKQAKRSNLLGNSHLLHDIEP